MMRLKKLTFNGFRTSSDSATVEFSDERVTVIYGDNGSGKTTYLRAINAFLSQDGAYLDSMAVHKIQCEFYFDEVREEVDNDGFVLNAEVINENILGYVEVNRIQGQSYDWTDFEYSALIKTKSLSLGVERGVATQQARIEPDVILNYFLQPHNRGWSKVLADGRGPGLHELADDISRYIRQWQINLSRSKKSDLNFKGMHINLQNIKLENIEQILLEHYKFARELATKHIQDALFNTLAVFADTNKVNFKSEFSKIDFIQELKINRLRLAEALSDNSKNEFKNLVIDKLRNLDTDASYESIFENGLLKVLIWNMLEQLKLEKLLLSRINLLTENFNKYLSAGKVLKILDDKVFIEVKDRELPVSDLSSGERHMLTFLTLVLFQGRKRNFLIIDEPEISLNIKWQRELLGLFNKLAPYTQIIVASHSPALARKNPVYLAELVIENNGASHE